MRNYLVKHEHHTGDGILVQARSSLGALRSALGPCRFNSVDRGEQRQRWEIGYGLGLENHDQPYTAATSLLWFGYLTRKAWLLKWIR